MRKDEQIVPENEAEVVTSEEEAAAAAAAEGATGGEAPEKKPGEGKEGDTPTETQTPEELERRKQNREAAEKRIEKKRLRELEIENARLKGFQEGVQKAGGKAEPGAGPRDDVAAIRTEFIRQHPKPKEDDFKTDGRSAQEAWELYQEALTDWKIDEREFVKERKAGNVTKDQEAGKMRETITSQREKGEEEFEDFAAVTGTLEATNTMLAAIYHSPEGHKLAYYLGQNPKEADRIALLPPVLQAKEIGKIESKIEAGTIQLKKPVSKAPEPAPKPGAKGATPDADEKRYVDPNTSTEERIRISQERKRRAAQGQ